MHLGLDDVMSDAILFFLIARVVDGHFVSCLGVIVLWWPCSSESDEPVYWLQVPALYSTGLYFWPIGL